MRRKWLSPMKSAFAETAYLFRSSDFGSHQDQGLRKSRNICRREDVEIIGRRGAVRDLQIVLRAQLQIAFEPRAMNAQAPVPRSRAEGASRSPLARSHLASPAATKLVDDALRAVGEVAKLRFPQHQALRVGERIAIFETEHAEFGQGTVADSKRPGRPSSAG